MMKSIFIFLLVSYFSYAQVGINTTTPQALLDVQSSNPANPSNMDGILVPRISAFPATNPSWGQKGLLVYLTTENNFYYWDGTKWEPFIRKIDHLADGKSDNDGTNNGSSVFLGKNAGANDDSSDNQNVGVGYSALKSNTTGQRNVAVGYNTLKANVTGSDNVAIGGSVLGKNKASFNTGVGSSVLRLNTTGANNTAVGQQALSSNVTGDNNTIFGFQAAVFSKASNNTVFGFQALHDNISGTNNTVFGYHAGYKTRGNNNVLIGYNANSGTSGYKNISGCVMIGANAGGSEKTYDNLLYIDNSKTKSPLIGGNFSTNRVGINTHRSQITHTLTVGGNVKATNYVATVGSGGYADYVFEKYYDGFSKINDEYRFLSLEDAEAFVKKHKHLPGVKSYQEIKDNNFEFNQTELTLKNLEKQEELFLYITQLNKKVKKQQQNVIELTKLLLAYKNKNKELTQKLKLQEQNNTLVITKN